MGMTSTAARTHGPAASRPGAPTMLLAVLAVLAVLVAPVLAGCGQGTGTAPGGPAAAPTTGGDGMGSTAPDPGGTAGPGGGTGSAGPVGPDPSGRPVPSVGPGAGLPGGADLPSDPAGADLVLVPGPPGQQQPPVTLACDWAAGTAGGTHPQAEQACGDLLAAVQAGDPFAPVPPDTMCTQQYGGDAVVEVSGAVLAADGAPVDVSARFTLTDGCEISRFEAMGAVLAPFRGSV